MNQTKKSSLKTKFYYVLLAPLLVIAGIAVFFAIQSAAYGARLTVLDEKAAKLASQNRELSSRLIESTSLSGLSGKTEELGYQKPDNILYLSSDSFVARLP